MFKWLYGRASSHVTGSLDNIQDSTPYSGFTTISAANGENMAITHMALSKFSNKREFCFE